MLEIWRARQQEEMRVAQFCGNNSVLLYPYASSRGVQSNIGYQFQPYAGASYNASRDSAIFDGKSPRLIRRSKMDDSAVRDSALLQRTEKLIFSPPRESKTAPKKHFMNQMLRNSKSLPVDDVTSKEFAYRTLDPKKGKLTKVKSKNSAGSKLKKSNVLNPFVVVPQQSNNLMNTTCSLASHFRNPKSFRNDFYSHSMLKEIHTLFDTGELPSKRWKEKYRFKRK